MIYTSGSIIVKEDMQTLSQQLLIGHQTEVATIAVSNDGWSLASSSHAHNKWRAEIRLWDLDTCQCNKVPITIYRIYPHNYLIIICYYF